jgi:hypothetical protein
VRDRTFQATQEFSMAALEAAIQQARVRAPK